MKYIFWLCTYRLSIFLFIGLSSACFSTSQVSTSSPPSDPLEMVSAEELRNKGLFFAKRGDLLRAQQYLSAAKSKGFQETIIVPELIKVCIAGSRFHTALSYAEPYIENFPDDIPMRYIVGIIYSSLDNIPKAIKHLHIAANANHPIYEATFSLALIAKANGNDQKARQHLQQYLKQRPNGKYARPAHHLISQLKTSR